MFDSEVFAAGYHWNKTDKVEVLHVRINNYCNHNNILHGVKTKPLTVENCLEIHK